MGYDRTLAVTTTEANGIELAAIKRKLRAVGATLGAWWTTTGHAG